MSPMAKKSFRFRRRAGASSSPPLEKNWPEKEKIVHRTVFTEVSRPFTWKISPFPAPHLHSSSPRWLHPPAEPITAPTDAGGDSANVSPRREQECDARRTSHITGYKKRFSDCSSDFADSNKHLNECAWRNFIREVFHSYTSYINMNINKCKYKCTIQMPLQRKSHRQELKWALNLSSLMSSRSSQSSIKNNAKH